MSNDSRLSDEHRDQSEQGRALSAPAQRQRIELSIPQLLAGALAAASAAVAASWLGVTGTILGAVVASVIASVGTALYKHPIERSSAALRENLPVRAAFPSQQRVVGQSRAVEAVHSAEPARPPVRGRRIRWAAVAVSTAMTLVLGFAILTGFETLLGRSAASLTGAEGHGGTTLTRIVDNAGASPGGNSDTPTGSDRSPSGEFANPDNAPTTNAVTTDAPTTDAPTTDAPTTAAPTTDAPTTAAPTTDSPTTAAPTTDAPTTAAPSTDAPTSGTPENVAPATRAPADTQ